MSIIRPNVAWGSRVKRLMITQFDTLGLLVPPLAQVRYDGGGVVAVESRAEVAPRLGKCGPQWRLANRKISINYGYGSDENHKTKSSMLNM